MRELFCASICVLVIYAKQKNNCVMRVNKVRVAEVQFDLQFQNNSISNVFHYLLAVCIEIIIFKMQMRTRQSEDEQHQILGSPNSKHQGPSNRKMQRHHAIKVFMMCFLLLLLLGAVVVLYNNNQAFKNNKATVTQILAEQVKIEQQIRNQLAQLKLENAKNHLRSQQKKNIENDKENTNLNQFIIPKILWIFSDDFQNQTLLAQKCLQNAKYFASESSFKVNMITSWNYHLWLSKQAQAKIGLTLASLQASTEQQVLDNLKTIKQQLVSFYILHENGGVLLDKSMVLTQNLAWIQSIQSNPYVNRGDHTATPQYLSFFDINHGSSVLPSNKLHSSNQYEQYMIIYPGVQTYFFAGVSQGEYLEKVLEQYCRILKDREYLLKVISTFQLHMGTLTPNDVYSNGFTIASHIVLYIKQLEISKKFREKSLVVQFAIDHFGLLTINNRYFPKKINHIFDYNFEEKIFQNIGIYSLEQLEQTVGPLRYMVFLIFQPELNNRLQQLTQNKSANLLLHPHSFLAKYIFLNVKNQQKGEYFMNELEKPITNMTAPKWQALPKIIWLFWTNGFRKTNSGNKICIENLIRNAKKSGFQVREINNSNIEYYIGKEINQKIDKVIKNHKIPVFAPTKSNFVRKVIIARYGGIYMDVSYLALESFDWILNIAQYPSQYIFNRYGQLPKILMFFHPHYGQPFHWTYNSQANTKNMQLVAYENNLIIAQPNQQLLQQWIDEYALVITSSYEDTKKRMDEYHVKDHSWTNDNQLYLTSMDSLKNVIGRKQNQLNEKAKVSGYGGPWSAADYYGIWSMSGYRGQQKIRINTNFDNSYYLNPKSSDNVFFYRYSIEYTQGILGRANQMIKLYNWNIRHLTELIEQQLEHNFTRKINPQSYCMKYLIEPLQDKIIKSVEQIHINDV